MALVLDNLKEALVEEFIKEEDLEKLWQEVKAMMQREGERVGDYIDRFPHYGKICPRLCSHRYRQK